MARPKDVLTTGEVARICNVAPRTVSKWFDTGKLRGYRIPGSKDRRIPLDQLVRFMRDHNIPLNGLDTGMTRVLVVETDRDVAELLSNALEKEANYEVRLARSAFEAGAATQVFKPHVLLMDVDVPGLGGRDGLRAVKTLPDCAGIKMIALTGSARPGDDELFKQQGYDATLPKPFDVSQAVKIIEASLPEPH